MQSVLALWRSFQTSCLQQNELKSEIILLYYHYHSNQIFSDVTRRCRSKNNFSIIGVKNNRFVFAPESADHKTFSQLVYSGRHFWVI